MKIKNRSLLICLITACNFCLAQVDSNLASKLQVILDSERKKINCYGVTAALLFPDDSIWLGTSGMSNPVTNEFMSSEMVGSIASISKTFISGIILQMVSEGKLSLDDKISRWLRAYNNIDGNITIRQLLNHTSGVYNYTKNYSFWSDMISNRNKKYSPEDILSYISGKSFNAGERFEYSNTNFILLGMIIEKISGNNLSNELHLRLLTPLRLDHTYLDSEDSFTEKLINNWTSQYGSFENIALYPRTSVSSGAWAAGGIYSTAENLVRWMKSLFDGKVIPPEYFAMMKEFTPISNNFYGLGLLQLSGANGKILGHTGSLPGYTSLAGYSPAANAYVALIFNQDVNLLSTADALIKTVIDYKEANSVNNNESLPEKLELLQNFPNPFNMETIISWRLAASDRVIIKIFDVLGRELLTLLDEYQSAGDHKIFFKAQSEATGKPLSSGIYLYQIRAGNFFDSKKMILIK